MDNQHRKIDGYRELSQAEIDMMNTIKSMGPQMEELLAKVGEHLAQCRQPALTEADALADLEGRPEDFNMTRARIDRAQPERWPRSRAPISRGSHGVDSRRGSTHVLLSR